jgi:hypothetical protein
MSNDESYIKSISGGGTLFAGPDATELFRAATIRSAIGLLQKGIQPTRGYTMKKALTAAAAITGKTYKRTESEQARTDLKLWCDTMSMALPKIAASQENEK